MKTAEFVKEHELVGMMWIEANEQKGIICFQFINVYGKQEGSWECHSVEGETPVETVHRVSKMDDSYTIEHYKTINYDVWKRLN